MARTETGPVVFTDLVGSTELASRVGHDAYNVPGHEHFTLGAAVAKHSSSGAGELTTASRAEAEQLGMAREIVRCERLRERMGT